MIRLAIAGILGRMGTCVAQLASRDDRFEIVAGLTERDDSRLGKSIRCGEADLAIVDRLPTPAQPGVPPCDVLIDFTVADGTMHWLEVCERLRIPMVIGATGHSESQIGRIQAAAHLIPIVKATNFSPGVAAVTRAIARLVAELGDEYDVEIVETHHRHKVDAPSGTALSILEAIRAARSALTSPGRKDVPSRDRGRLQSRDREGAVAATVPARGAGVTPSVVFGRHGRVGERKPGEIGVHSVRMGEHVGQHEIHLSAAGETITLRHTAHSREAFAAGALRAAAWLISRPPGCYTMNDVLG
jgi:4-hydroxy-tetrahydrodipicolinate reductase